MLSKKFYFQLIGVLFAAITLNSCIFSNNSNDQVLKDQVSALETQNALLQQVNSENSSNPSNVQAPLPPATEVTIVEMIQPTSESLPTNPVSAGQPIIYNGWALTVNPEFTIKDDLIYIELLLRNLKDTDRVFRFVRWDISLSDNLGTNFQKNMESPSCLDWYKLPAQKTIEANDTITFKSSSMKLYSTDSCDFYLGNTFPSFKGVIPIDTKQLIVTIDNWGPFSEIEVYIDL